MRFGLPSPQLWHLETSPAPRPSISSSKSDPLPSSYLFGAPLERARTRTSSISSATTSPPSDLLASPASCTSPYSLGSPLSRVRTRTDSTADLHVAPAPKPLYQDTSVHLSHTHLTISHLLLRRAVSFPISRIRSCRPLLSASQRIQLACGGRHSPNDALVGITNGGLGWTGITWARDARRIGDDKAAKGLLIVLEVDGWLGRVGFSVEDEGSWWASWAGVAGAEQSS